MYYYCAAKLLYIFVLNFHSCLMLMIIVRKLYLIIFLISNAVVLNAQNRFTLSGYVRDSLSRETLIGATVQAKETGRAVGTNQYGFYSLTLPEGEYTLLVSFVGYFPFEKKISLHADLELNLPVLSKSN